MDRRFLLDYLEKKGGYCDLDKFVAAKRTAPARVEAIEGRDVA